MPAGRSMLLRACTSYRTLPHGLFIVLSSMCPTTQQPCMGLSTSGMQGLAGPCGCTSQPCFHRGACSHSIPPLPQAAAAAAAIHAGPSGNPSWSFTCSHNQQQQDQQQLQPQLLRAKSAKRKAAEALLAARYGPAVAADTRSPDGPRPGTGSSSSPPLCASKAVFGSDAKPAATAAAAAAQRHPAANGLFTGISQAAGGQAGLLQPQPKRLCSSLAASSATAEAASGAAAGSRIWGPAPSQQDGAEASAAAGADEHGSAEPGANSSSSSSAAGGVTAKGSKRGGHAGSVAVPACPPACRHPFANAWCHFQVGGGAGTGVCMFTGCLLYQPVKAPMLHHHAAGLLAALSCHVHHCLVHLLSIPVACKVWLCIAPLSAPAASRHPSTPPCY
jgi:hypothetical protein